MAYGLLPNKKQTTYRKFFKLLKKHVPNSPETFNIDFEKAAMNAALKVFTVFKRISLFCKTRLLTIYIYKNCVYVCIYIIIFD